MRFISTSTHGLIDYIVGAILMLAPFVLGFSATGGAALWVPVLLGGGIIVYSLFTRYERSVYPLIPMPVHLALDGLGGLFLAASPWLFNFASEVWLPHVAIGVFDIVASLTTRTSAPATQRV